MSTASPREAREVPAGVVRLLQRAVGAMGARRTEDAAVGPGVLDSVEAMAAALAETGWVRQVPSGAWAYRADPSWTVQSAAHEPIVGIFTSGELERLLHLTAALHALIESGRVGAMRAGRAQHGWSTWSNARVRLSLYEGEEQRVNTHLVPGLVQLHIQRVDSPVHKPALDPQLARRLARDGSALTRWYLAGEDELPEDVVAVLAADREASVVAALDANAGRRERLARGQL
ncbi:hypothetical protein GCM10027586_07960 [Kineococcus gypseus]|uniref:hypothetical protein n=1 Tax=Kineococcus gypseus TaxID=1637102 RepID=UPI003D7DE7C3